MLAPMSRVARAVFVVILMAPVAASTAPAPGGVAIPVAPVTCADAGVLLARTFATYDDSLVSKNEGEIAKACTAASWPQPVLDCLGSTIGDTAACIAKLPHDQQVALVASVTTATPPQGSAAAGGDADADADANKFTSCEDAVAQPLAFGDAPGTGSDDATFALALRRHELVGACVADGWSEHAKECFAKATDSDHVLTCIKKLPDEAQQHVVSEVVDAEDLATRTFAARKTAANITCAKVVGAHYGDAAWKKRLTKVKPADRKAAIAASRTRMTKACTADKWTEDLRACVVAGGDYPTCATFSDEASQDPWGFPASGVLVPTGVAACDKYLAALVKLAECPAEKESREMLLGMATSGMATVSEAADQQKQVLTEACTAATKGLLDESKSRGCK
jgi:hypothetical protein